MLALPLSIKLRMTQDRIRAWYNNFGGDVYVSRSGGKDSDVLGDIVSKMYPDVPHVFIDTGLEWISVQKHGRDVADEILYPKMNFVEVIKKYGYPVVTKEVAQKVCEARSKPDGQSAKRFMDCEHNRRFPAFSMERYAWLLEAPFKISNRCCDVNKKRVAKSYERRTGRKPMVATMVNESRLRKAEWFKNGCNAFDATRPMSKPMAFWTEQDVLQYIKENDLKIADVYGDIVCNENKYYTSGIDRTGCVWCLFGMKRDSDRLLRLKELEPKRYDFVLGGGEFVDGLWQPNKDGLGYKFVIDWLNQHGNMGIRY